MTAPRWRGDTSTAPHDDDVLDAGVMAADLAGYTAMSEVHGDQLAAEVGDELLGFMRTDVGPGRVLTKGLGDGVLAVDVDPAHLARRALDLLHQVGTTPERPRLRVVLHHGPVVRRGGDVYGRTMNVASRLVEAAPDGRATATAAFVRVTTDLAGVTVGHPRRVSLRSVRDPVEVHDLVRCRDDHLDRVDPVCRMVLDPDDPTVVWVHTAAGLVAFCSTACADAAQQQA